MIQCKTICAMKNGPLDSCCARPMHMQNALFRRSIHRFQCNISDVHWRETEDLAPLHGAQLRADDAAEPAADGLAVLCDEDAGVVVEADDAAVGALPLLGRAHHDGVPDVAAAHLVGRQGRAAAGLAVELALLLHDDDDAVAWCLG